MKNQLPLAFIDRVKNDELLGSELLEALDTAPPISLRLNPSKKRSSLPFSNNVPWCENGFYLNERPQFTLDPLFHAGAYYPQEAGSMVLDALLRQLPLGEQPTILDVCAAPGGKSTLISSFLENRGLLVSNEVIQARARILKENTIKWGYSSTIVTNNDPKDFERLPHFFDVLVIDAPCSGEGMFRKDSAARNEWSEEHVALCASRQKRIVMDVWESLSPGGFMIYSTCTFNADENENNVLWMMNETGAELLPMAFPFELTRGRNGIGNYCLPSKIATEGFYCAVLQKPQGQMAKQRFTRKNEFKHQKELFDLPEYADLNGVTVINWNNKLLALPKHFEEKMLHIQSQMRLQKMGTSLGEVMKGKTIPHEELALSAQLIHYPKRIDLSEKEALRYLHGDTFQLAGTLGYQLITFQHEPLGWLKHLGNRFNNLYPKEWRIRMDVG